LDLAFRRHERADYAGARRPDCKCRDIELRCIRQIEELAAELQADALRDLKRPRDPEIQIELPWPTQDSPAGIAENSRCWRLKKR
jgi:hypothetical protein